MRVLPATIAPRPPVLLTSRARDVMAAAGNQVATRRESAGARRKGVDLKGKGLISNMQQIYSFNELH